MSRLRRFRIAGVCAATLTGALLALVLPAAPGGAEEPVVGEVLAILKQRGLVDEARYQELVARNQAYEASRQSLRDRIQWSGDMRARLENFWFDEDETGVDRPNRTRARYRLRIQAKARVHDQIDAVFRLASGAGDNDSRNQTVGGNLDFAPDDISIDRAFIALRAPETWIPEGSSFRVELGKLPNPFLWDATRDVMLWDHDITPGGVGAHLGFEVAGARLFATAGYMIADENSRARDPHVLGLQGGAVFPLAGDLELGTRVSWYEWGSLDSAFLARAIAEGSTARPGEGLSDAFSTGELAAYLRYSALRRWPVLLFGHLAHNFASTELQAGSSQEDDGWGVGLEVGDKRQLVKLGIGYYRLEANFWPAQFIDSDVTDGITNREAWTFYGSRQLLPGTDLNVTLYMSDELEDDLSVFGVSTRDAERFRLQTDLVVKF